MASNIEQVWKDVTIDIPEDVADKWWSRLIEKYSESGRAYHNVQHLQTKFDQFKTVKEAVDNPNAIALALFFHYFEYDPKAVDCDEKNVEHFKSFANEARIQNESPLHSKVVSLLQAAATHSTDEHKTGGAYGSEDCHYFLDIDIAVLGSSPEDYGQYTARVQQEYDFLPESMYKSLRLKVLQNFLQIPNIFATKEFREQLESKARANIQKEVETLKS